MSKTKKYEAAIDELPMPNYHKRRIKTWLNKHEFPTKGEVNNQPSMTVPDQTMSVQEILKRYAKGLPLDGQKIPIYDGEDDYLPDPRHMDLADRQELREQIESDLSDFKFKRHAKKPIEIPPAPTVPPGGADELEPK